MEELMFESLVNTPRLLLEAELKPVQGDRFQPTGFADLGAAVYERPDGQRMLLVESAQSVANRLEQTCLGTDGAHIADELKGLPYVVAKLTGETQTETSSLVEAHRINSPFIISDDAFRDAFVNKSGYAKGKPLNWQKIAQAFLFYDPNSLLHGVFMANLEDGRVRLPRALSGFIEAEDVREAASGGVKNNPLDPTGKIRAKSYDKDVYSNVPYPRMEYTARRIVAYFNLDLALLEGYGLDLDARELLIALGLYKIRRFISTGLRLRTACDLDLAPGTNIKVTAPKDFAVPAETVLLDKVKASITACTRRKLFVQPPVTELTTETVLKASERARSGAARAPETKPATTDGSGNGDQL
jgi:CRISPR-associated protein Csb1